MISSVSASFKFYELKQKFQNIEELNKYVEIFNTCLVDFRGNETDIEKYEEDCREGYENFCKNKFPSQLSFNVEDEIFVLIDEKNNRRLYSEMIGDITPSCDIQSSCLQSNFLGNDISHESVSDLEDNETEFAQDVINCLMHVEDDSHPIQTCTTPILTYPILNGQFEFLLGNIREVFKQKDTAEENVIILQNNCVLLREECASLKGQLEKVVDDSKKLKAENEDLVKQLNDAKSQLRKHKKDSEVKHVDLTQRINGILKQYQSVPNYHPRRVIEIKSESEEEEEEEEEEDYE